MCSNDLDSNHVLTPFMKGLELITVGTYDGSVAIVALPDSDRTAAPRLSRFFLHGLCQFSTDPTQE